MAEYLVSFGYRLETESREDVYHDLMARCEVLGGVKRAQAGYYILRSPLSAEALKSELLPFVYNGSPLNVFPLDF